MGSYDVKGDVLAQGINCKLRIDVDDPNGSNPVVVGFVQDAQMRKSINIQRAEVIGEILPVSIDPTSIQVSTSLKGFIPSKKLVDAGIDSVRGGGKLSIKSFNTDDSRLADTKVATKIPYLDIYDDKHKSIIGSTTWATATNFSEGVSGKGYPVADCTLESIGYDNGTDYESIT